MDAQKYRALSVHDRALIALAVLLDGREAAVYLENDAQSGVALRRAALDLATMDPDMRMPFLGTQLRAVLAQLRES